MNYTQRIESLKEYGYAIGSKAYLYRTFGANDEQIKRFVEDSKPIAIKNNENLENVYIVAARSGFSVDKGQKYNKEVFDLMKTAMKGTVENWNNGQYKTFRKL